MHLLPLCVLAAAGCETTVAPPSTTTVTAPVGTWDYASLAIIVVASCIAGLLLVGAISIIAVYCYR